MEQWFDNEDRGSDEDANVDLQCRVLGRLCDISGVMNSQNINLNPNDSIKCGSCHCDGIICCWAQVLHVRMDVIKTPRAVSVGKPSMATPRLRNPIKQ